jgi:hypothetical protein
MGSSGTGSCKRAGSSMSISRPAGASAATKLSVTTSAQATRSTGRQLRLGGGAGHSHSGPLGARTFAAPGASIHTSGGMSRIGGRVRTRWMSGCITARHGGAQVVRPVCGKPLVRLRYSVT